MDNFVGEIRLFASPGVSHQPPENWAFCNGQLLAVQDYQALFSLIGYMYGGNGVSTFALPNLQGRVVAGQGQLPGGSAYALGQSGGTEVVALTAAQLPSHTHTAYGTAADATTGTPGPTVGLAQPTPMGTSAYLTQGGTLVAFAADAVGMSGGGGSHLNVMPSLCINYIIALKGNYPQRAT